MDHAEVREVLEIAAVEPGGLDRLMAGDTPEAAAIAGHIAGCDPCADELRRLHAAAGLIRDVVRSQPPADLRARTLAYVDALGRARGPSAAAQAPVGPTDAAPVSAGSPIAADHARRRQPIPARWLAALAAVLVVAVAGGALVLGQQNVELTRRAEAVAALERVAAAGIRVASAPDRALVELRPAAGAAAAGAEAASGTLAFSPGTRELVVIARDLPRPADGREFRCWVESGGERRSVGRMYFANELAFWVGEVEAVADLDPGARFGVSLVDRAGDVLGGDAALLGER